MKDIVISNEVKHKIEKLMKQLHTLCEDNNVPMLVGVILERTETDEGIYTNKAISVFIDSSTGAFDSTLAAAAEIIRLDRVPISAINAISSLREDIKQRNKTQSKNFH